MCFSAFQKCRKQQFILNRLFLCDSFLNINFSAVSVPGSFILTCILSPLSHSVVLRGRLPSSSRPLSSPPEHKKMKQRRIIQQIVFLNSRFHHRIYFMTHSYIINASNPIKISKKEKIWDAQFLTVIVVYSNLCRFLLQKCFFSFHAYKNVSFWPFFNFLFCLACICLFFTCFNFYDCRGCRFSKAGPKS